MPNRVVWKENLPAINVKTHQLNFDILSKEEEAQAAEFLGKEWQSKAWEWLIEDWWRQAEEIAKEVFGLKTEVFQTGRMGGWLQVKGTGFDVMILAQLDFEPDDSSEEAEEQRRLLDKWSNFNVQIKDHLKQAPEMYKAIVLNEIWKEIEKRAENLFQKQEDRRALIQDLVLATRTGDDINKILDKHLGKVE